MKTSIRLVAVAMLWSTAGCADWFQADTCGPPSLRLDITPAPSCLQLSVVKDSRPGFYQIIGTNGCTDDLVVQSPFTHDGGASSTFVAGGHVIIPLSDSEVYNQGPMKMWERTGGLGTQLISIVVTKGPC